jgi:hypothetical protein
VSLVQVSLQPQLHQEVPEGVLGCAAMCSLEGTGRDVLEKPMW